MSVTESVWGNYIIVNNGGNWNYTDAKDHCLSLGRYPVSFGDESEYNSVVNEWKNRYSGESFWIGLECTIPSGSTNTADFIWVDGTDRTYDGFWSSNAGGQPNNHGSGNQACTLWRANDGVHDYQCTELRAIGIICESVTFSPTSHPTSNPSAVTAQPTSDPSANPTVGPSDSPTANPTLAPVLSTSKPSSSPTMIPSSSPTATPISSFPTENPSTQSSAEEDGNQSADEDADDSDDNGDEKTNSANNGNDIEEMLLIISIVGSLFGCCLLLCCAGVIYKLQQVHTELKVSQIENIPAQSPRSDYNDDLEIDFKQVSLEGKVSNPVFLSDSVVTYPTATSEGNEGLVVDSTHETNNVKTDDGGHFRRLSNVDELYNNPPNGHETIR